MPDYSQKPNDIHALVTRLIELGYYPVPIPGGCKGPTIEGWQNLRMKPEDVPFYFAEPGMLVGVLHKNTCFIDVDVYDADLATTIADEAKRRFPGALERVGQYPKTAIVLGLDEVGYKVRNTRRAEAEIDGQTLTAQVEIRTLTRQAVVYGRHPETQQNYRWIGRDLWQTPVSDLPKATQAEMQDFRDWADAQIREWAGITDGPQTAQLFDASRFITGTSEANKATDDEFLAALRYIPASVGYDDWLAALMGIHDFYAGSQAGLQVAHQWSSDYSHYSANEVNAKWRSFEVGKGVTYKTVFQMAKSAGADLSAIARMNRTEPARALSIAVNVTAGATATADEWDDAPEPAQAQAQSAPPDTGLEWFADIGVALGNDYIVKGVIDSGTMSVIYGPSNSGKTFFAMDLAYHLAAGLQWRQHRVKQACVLYLAAEGGRGVLNRVSAIKKEFGVQSIPFAVKRAGLDLLNKEADLETIFNLAQEVKAKSPELPLVIFIDTLSRVMAGGDENSAADMTQLIRNIDAIRELTGAHIVLVHHTGKDTARGARGHSSLRAATDTEIEVQSEDGARAAMVTKQRDHAGGEVYAFQLKSINLGTDQDGDDVTSCVVEATDSDEYKAAKKAAKGVGVNQRIIMETFDQMLGEGLGKPNPGGVGLPETGQFWTVNFDDLKRIATSKMDAVNARDAWSRAWRSLSAENGVFRMVSGLCWRSDRKVKH